MQDKSIQKHLFCRGIDFAYRSSKRCPRFNIPTTSAVKNEDGLEQEAFAVQVVQMVLKSTTTVDSNLTHYNNNTDNINNDMLQIKPLF